METAAQRRGGKRSFAVRAFKDGYLAALLDQDAEVERYDPEADKRPYTELTRFEQIARERASFKRQLDAVDRALCWKGTGFGRVGCAERLREALRFYADPRKLITFANAHNVPSYHDREHGAGWWAVNMAKPASAALNEGAGDEA